METLPDCQAGNAWNSSYYIDGFRSLIDFHISLHPGINVLVGPNGSGKTNFIDFLDFLDSMLRHGASTAVSSVGGIARLFSQENIRSASPKISARICGVAELPGRDQVMLSGRVFNFEYEVEVRFSRALSALYISREWLKLKKLRLIDEVKHANTTVGVISVTRRSPAEDVPASWRVGRRLFSQSERNPLNVLPAYMNSEPKAILDRLRGVVIASDESILSNRPGALALDAVRIAVTRGRSFNIIPARAREPDDLTKPPVILRDGAGLSSTLHHLQAVKRSKGARRNLRLRRVSKNSLDMVVEWTKLVFPELRDILVVQDPHTGKYLGYLVVGGSEKPLRIPLQAASDGTLKWLCFVCLIIAVGGTHSIEEPENFLHPKMQQFLIKLIRDSMEDEERSSYFIVSTHSETIINQCAPSELILFEFLENRTVCRKISNPDRVQAEINRTGFGLGYYYASNSLS